MPIIYEYSATVEAGKVIRTDPPYDPTANTYFDPNDPDPITYYVSLGGTPRWTVIPAVSATWTIQ